MEAQSTVRVPLTVEKRADIGDKLASLVEQIKGVKAEAKSKAFAFRAEIEGLQEDQERLAAEMILGLEDRSQMSLTFAESEAAKALHDVVAHAECTCEGGPESELKSPSCALHGVETRGVNATCDGNHAPADPCGDPRCYLTDDLPEDETSAPAGEELASAEAVRELADTLDAIAPSTMADAIRGRRRHGRGAGGRDGVPRGEGAEEGGSRVSPADAIPVRLAALRYGEEFTSRATGLRGVVVDTGYVIWEDTAGRGTRVRAVLVRFGAVEKIILAECMVLVDADRPHQRMDQSAARWGKLLREPGTFASVGDVAVSKRPPGARRGIAGRS